MKLLAFLLDPPTPTTGLSLPRQSSVEMVIRHSPFRNVDSLRARCEACGWASSGSQGYTTAAARKHVRANLDHVVITQRTQQKVTRARKTTVLR